MTALTDFHAARAYLAAPAGAVWRWSADATVIAWRDGTTIAFREEIETVLRRLAPSGWPPFGAVVLVLAACRGDWRTNGSVTEMMGTLAKMLRKFGNVDAWFAEVVFGLDTIANLPAELRAPAEGKAAIVEAVFESARRPVPAEVAEAVLVRWPTFFPATLAKVREEQNLGELLSELACLQRGLAGVDWEHLEWRIKTGLDRPIVPAPLDAEDLPDAAHARELLAELRNDRELSGLARLARDLMAAISVPRHVAALDELAVGGISDISNRGTLDRLLISELAADDLTLAMRVALNEAMYLRRESPPKSPPTQRNLLLDTGIRMWGTPRVFATAVGLAMVATADANAIVRVFRPTDAGLEAANVATRAGLMAHLETLSTLAHPGELLADFVAAIGADANAEADGAGDAIVVTGADVLADAAFRAKLHATISARGGEPILVATVSREGAYELWAVGLRGRKLLNQARLNVADVLAPPAATLPGTPLTGALRAPMTAASEFPAAVLTDVFPLRLPREVPRHRAVFREEFGAVGLTRDGRMLFWDRVGWAPVELTARVPGGRLAVLDIDDSGIARAVIVRSTTAGHRVELLSADLVTRDVSMHPLPASQTHPRGAAIRAGQLLLMFRDAVDVFDLQNGMRSETLALPISMKWLRDRFFVDRAFDDVYAMAADGARVWLDAVPVAAKYSGQIRGAWSGWLVFDREGTDGPWTITTDGSAVALDGSQQISIAGALQKSLRPVEVSRDGHRVLARDADTNAAHLLDLKAAQSRSLPGSLPGSLPEWGLAEALEPKLYLLMRPNTHIRNRFRAVSVNGGKLVLVSKQQRGFILALAGDQTPEMRLVPAGRISSQRSTPFSIRLTSECFRFGLLRARFADGSRIFLDSRGLLHLQSSDRTLPEVSLVLRDGPLAAWVSDGRVAGPEMFCGDVERVPATEIMPVIREILTRIRDMK